MTTTTRRPARSTMLSAASNPFRVRFGGGLISVEHFGAG